MLDWFVIRKKAVRFQWWKPLYTLALRTRKWIQSDSGAIDFNEDEYSFCHLRKKGDHWTNDEWRASWNRTKKCQHSLLVHILQKGRTSKSVQRRFIESCLPQTDRRYCTKNRDLSCMLNCHIVLDETDSSWQEKTRLYFTTQCMISRRIINPSYKTVEQ